MPANRPRTQKSSGLTPPAHPVGVNILLHGFWFMEFQDNMLVAASPYLEGHSFQFRNHGDGQPQPVPPKEPGKDPVEDLFDSLNSGTVIDFVSDMMLRFSKTDMDLPRKYLAKLDQPYKTYTGVILLPLPIQVLSFRLGSFANFHADPNGNVIDSINTLHGSQEASSLITCLQYTAIDGNGFTRSYYAEHNHNPKPSEVNAALDAARTAFGPEFDLHVTSDCDAEIVPPDDSNNLPAAVWQDDERELQELKRKPEDMFTVEVGTCPQFGVVE